MAEASGEAPYSVRADRPVLEGAWGWQAAVGVPAVSGGPRRWRAIAASIRPHQRVRVLRHSGVHVVPAFGAQARLARRLPLLHVRSQRCPPPSPFPVSSHLPRQQTRVGHADAAAGARRARGALTIHSALARKHAHAAKTRAPHHPRQDAVANRFWRVTAEPAERVS